MEVAGEGGYEPPPTLQLPGELGEAAGAAAGGDSTPPPRDAPASELLAYALTGALPAALVGHPALRRSSVAGFGASQRGGGAAEAVQPPPFASQAAFELAIAGAVQAATGVRAAP